MAKITRKIMKIFGSSAGPSEIAKFGSLAAAAPAYSTDPTVIQSLSNYLDGWLGAVIGANSPALEDMNALCYLYAYQLAYLMQAGVAEWDSTTTYYIGSLVNDGTGIIYRSIVDNNLDNALTDAAAWTSLSYSPIASVSFAENPVSLSASDSGKIFMVDLSLGNVEFILPNPATVGAGFTFTAADAAGLFSPLGSPSAYAHPYSTELIAGVNTDYVFQSAWGSYTLFTDGTNWFKK